MNLTIELQRIATFQPKMQPSLSVEIRFIQEALECAAVESGMPTAEFVTKLSHADRVAIVREARAELRQQVSEVPA